MRPLLLQVSLLTMLRKFTAGRPVKIIEVRLGASVEEVPKDVVYSRFEDPDTGQDELPKETTEGDEWGTGQVVYLIAAVKDSGIGISEEDLPNLFQRFRRESDIGAL